MLLDEKHEEVLEEVRSLQSYIERSHDTILLAFKNTMALPAPLMRDRASNCGRRYNEKPGEAGTQTGADGTS
jgi:hypothetical protein